MLHFKCIIPNTGKTVNNRTHSLRDILRMVVIDSVINTVPGGLTLDPVRMRRHKIRKIAVEILQSVNNRTQSLHEISYYALLLLTQ